MVPLIETARLRLREHRATDLDAQAATLADPHVARYIGGKPLSREETWRRMLCGPGMWAMLGYGYWTVERKDDGRVIGQVGFADFKRDIMPSIEGVPEMGWIFAAHGQGQGFASEAVAAAVAWGTAKLPAGDYCCIIDPANQPSIRLAQKAGFIDPIETRYKDEPILLFRRPPHG